LQGLIAVSGAMFTPTLTRKVNTHLLCKYTEGKKWEMAIEWGNINIVNAKWIEDAVKTWTLCKYDDPKYTTFEAEPQK
jgi:hypothetical protein